MKHEATFSVCGALEKVYIAPSGKFAKMTISSIGGKGNAVRNVVRGFADVVPAIQALGVGQVVTVTGSIEREALKNKAKEDVKVDGYTAWTDVLTARAITAEGPVPAPKTDDDDIRF